jgi:hypothetical protein
LFFFLFKDSKFSLHGFIVAEDVIIDVAFSFAMVSSSIGMSTYLSHDGFVSLVLLSQNISVLVVFF